jgi:hypothetical protein
MKPLALALLAASSALAGTTDDRIPDAKYLAYAEGFRPYARPVRVVEPSGTPAHSTSVVIGDHWALTAAHVVHDAAVASVGDNRVVTIWVHPDYEKGEFGWFDIAVLWCERDFGLDYYPPLATGEEEVGAIVSIAGFGVTGRLSSGYDHLDNKLRAGTARISRFERTIMVSDARAVGTALPLCISPGDSGGPWFSGAGPNSRLVGISSFTMKDKGPLRSRVGEEQGATRVAYFKEWIERVRRMVP